MAKDPVELYTKDTIVATTSKGNQEKWFDAEAGLWYKLDCHGFESLAEAVTSRLLRRYTNLAAFDRNLQSNRADCKSMPPLSPAKILEVAEYDVTRVEVHKHLRTVSVSKNFLAPGESIVTAYTLLKNGLGRDFAAQLNRPKSLSRKIEFLADTIAGMTGLADFGRYLTLLFEIDALILNQDRHLNNIAVLRGANGYSFCPIFDNGAAYLLDYALYPYEVDPKSLITQADALPFHTSFTRLAHTARALYGPQLQVQFTKADIAQLLQPLLDYYPAALRGALQERIITVLMTQQKKLFRNL
jgi:hypothetical protein